MVDEEDWEELAGRPRKGRQSKKQRKKRTKTEQLDAEYQRAEQNKFLQGLNDNQGRYEWMKEKRYNTMFRDIESKIQGALGTGTYDWVDRRVFDQVFDRLTLMALYKIMKSGVVDTLDFPVARGKEAHVFHATNLAGEPVAVKIFHTSNAVFKNLIQYIEGDPRFTGLRRKHRDLVEVWVRKEYRNLNRLARWGLNVPQARDVHKNVLVMDYLGTDTSPSPKLRDVHIDDPQAVYDDLLHFLAVAWQKANLVHGDFSPYNILWHEGRACIIDVGQAVVESHPKAQEFLVRDVTRLVEWGQKNGLDVTLADAMYDVLNMDLSHVEQVELI
ncbi:MAG: serine protein kinase RIO [Euryarchaeota archaeon]|nr:serine protein kinase RIO [Euryarchaeota archaeon]|tara:strand:- start:1059 stop:2045 length:987 start_codon:yes stop_codon:yes gene_type:complete